MARTLALVGLVAAVAAAVVPAAATRLAGTTIDQTLLCTPGSFGGIRGIHVGAASRQEGAGVPALGDVTSDKPLVWVETPSVPDRHPGVTVNAKRCHVTKTRVPLTTRGLSGGAATFGDDVSCETGKQVLVRIRAVMAARVVWTSKPPYRIAYGTPLTAAIAVRTTSRKPLAYVSVDDRAGTASLFSAAACY